MAETPQHPPGSFGCCNLLIPLAMIAGGIVGFRQGDSLGLILGALGGFAIVVHGITTWGRDVSCPAALYCTYR